MRLSNGQRDSIEALSKILSLETLLKIKEGNTREFAKLHLKLFNPGSEEEKQEMNTIIEKEIAERRKKLKKAFQINC